MIEAVLPEGVTWAEVRDDPPEAALLPEEEPLAALAVERRRRELTTGRYCARRALAQIGVAPGPILAGSRGEPLWPEGVVGSITHCAGYRAAAVASAGDVPTVGIDAEPHEPLPSGVLDTIALPQEHGQLVRLAQAHPEVCWDRLLFCSKEAVYKAWYPHAQAMLDFREAEMTLEPAHAGPATVSGSLHARLLVPGPVVGGRQVGGFEGRWAIGQGLVVTAVTQLR